LVQDTKTKITYALKVISKALVVRAQQQAHIMSEKRVMEQLEHPFIINLYQTFQDPNTVYFRMEVCLGGDFFGYLRERGNFEEGVARFYSGCVVELLEHLHSLDIIYRDLKPENLLLDREGYVKMIDFGFACWIGSGRTFTLCGTPDYMCPEIVAGRGHGKGVDCWTLGILLYEMLAGYPPFYDQDPMREYQKIQTSEVEFPSHFTPEAKDLIQQLLQKNPSKRLGVGKDGWQRVKKHKWFKDFDWKALYEKKIKAPYVPNVKIDIDMDNFHKYPVPPEEVVPYVDDGTGWCEDFGPWIDAGATPHAAVQLPSSPSPRSPRSQPKPSSQSPRGVPVAAAPAGAAASQSASSRKKNSLRAHG
jgi:serine/threonine protein kinase